LSRYSIILPVRNGGAYVKECVKSILAQTYAGFNLLVLDNSSTDDTIQWISAQNDSRIKIIPSSDSLSIGENWERVLGIEKNEFITLIGHDDLLEPFYLEEMDKLIQAHPGASLYQSHFNFIDAEGKLLKPCMPMHEVQSGAEFLAAQMAKTMDSTGTGYMMRSVDFDYFGGLHKSYPKLLFADYQLWVQLSLKSYKATSDKFCFSYRIHNSTSGQANGEDYSQAFEKYVFFISSLMKNEKVKSVVDHYFHDYLMYFCESLSHRILKSPERNRKKTVSEFIEKCKEYAALLIPQQDFDPLKKSRINIAKKLDRFYITRRSFQIFRKLF
jgi:glycosyltransferase involved in cell wall biosynthesis